MFLMQITFVNVLPETYSKLCFSCKHFPVVQAHVVLMEQNHHLCSKRDTNMDTSDDSHMETMGMETEDADSCSRLSDETLQHLLISEQPSGSCKVVRERFRPKLQTTKSFPPYSQCIGGLGDDEEFKEINSESNVVYQPNVREGGYEETKGTERKADLTTRCSREGVKAKWRSRRKERSEGSFEITTEGLERGRSSGKRRVEESGKESDKDDEKRGAGTSNEGKHWRGRSSGFEKSKEEEDRKRSLSSAVVEENSSRGETLEGKDEEADGMTEGSTQPHPILSRLLYSSSTSSSSSSINLSSAESDEVFSEGEDAASKRSSFRKVRKADPAYIDPLLFFFNMFLELFASNSLVSPLYIWLLWFSMLEA